jgi:AraC-like DNA-binding protein
VNTRIQKAEDLLINTAKSVKEVAKILGFESPSHFSKQFKQRVGTAPGDWRNKFIRARPQAGPGAV